MSKICLFITILVVVLAIPVWSEKIVEPNNVLRLHMEESAGPTFLDSSGFGHHAVCSGSHCPGAGLRGEFGAALTFDGKQDSVLVDGMGFEDFTIEAWILSAGSNLTGTHCSDGAGIVVANGSSAADNWVLGILGNKLCFATGSNPDTDIVGVSKLNDGVWHHVVATRSIRGEKEIFVDGVLQSHSTSAKADLVARLRIDIGGNTTDSRYFKGMIDEVGFYNMVLPDEDIVTHYKRGALRQEAVLDPLGRFVVYSATLPGCVKARPVFQALTKDGAPLGAPRLLVDCKFLPEDAQGIDLAADGNTGQYWLSFGGTRITDSRYVMKIDALGKAILPPKSVLAAATTGFEPGATALIDGPVLQMWSTGYDGWLYQSLINKKTLTITSTRKASWASTSETGVHFAQSTARQFMGCEEPKGVFTAFGMSKGVWDGTTWRLSPRTDRAHKTGSISADGLMALSVDSNSPTEVLYAQPLRDNGHPTGAPKVVARSTFGVVDISSALPAGTRFVLYSANGALYLQRINAVTADKLGSVVLLNR